MKTNKTLITISLLLVLTLAITACSSNDSNELKPEGEAGLQLSFNKQSGISTQAVDETIEEKTTITEVKITVYEKSDYDSNGTSAEVVENKTGTGSSLSDIGAIALYLPANQDYVIEAVLSGEVTNDGTTNSVTGIYHGILDSTGVLQDKNTKEITVDVSLAKAQQLDVEISNLAEQVGTTTDIASMDVELWVPTVGTVTKNITSGQTVSFSSQDQLDNSSDNLELLPTVAQVDIQLKDSSGDDIVKAGEFGGEVLLLPKQSQSLTVDQQPYLELDKASVSVDESGGAEDTLTFSLTAADPDGDEVTLGIDDTTKPSGASFDASTGEFSWSPGTDQQGTYEVVFTAESSGGSTQEMVTITVNDKLDIDVNQITSPNAPVISSADYKNSAVSLTVDSATGNADYLVYRNTVDDSAGAEPVSDVLVDVTTWSDSSVEEGNIYYYWVKKYSSDGLSSRLSNSVELDNKAPSPATNVNVSLAPDASADISWDQGSDPNFDHEEVIYKLENDDNWKPVDQSATSPIRYEGADGESVQFRVLTFDDAGNSVSTDPTTAKTLDGTAPTAEINSPTSTVYVQSGSSISIDYTATDANFETATLSGYIPGETLFRQEVNAGEGNIESINIPADANERVYYLKLIVEDAARNSESVIKGSIIKVDDTAPIFNYVNSDSEVYRNGTQIKVTADIGEPGLTVSADFSNIDEQFEPENVTVTDNSDGTYSIEYPINYSNPAADGTYTIPVTAEDRAGNSTTDNSLSVELDNTRPSVNLDTLSDINADNSDSYTISGSTEADATVDVTLDDTMTTVTSSTVAESDGTFSLTVDVSSLTGAQVSIEVTATDDAGNMDIESTNVTNNDTSN
ncbi:Ig-like domain-containing protein [Halanaerobacter jeridensis]|uniref:Uncharacterized protein n=1 Tax=Halanaerobacter jeridensis TaxID=706427 RepID=A0A938XUE0_9FIRM|nr:Ig-like domain-containing protein [Halanaerobacter jeridensis]MBM7557074.1 hypothetical protein [Halanaerobacter jeridensis]